MSLKNFKGQGWYIVLPLTNDLVEGPYTEREDAIADALLINEWDEFAITFFLSDGSMRKFGSKKIEKLSVNKKSSSSIQSTIESAWMTIADEIESLLKKNGFEVTGKGSDLNGLVMYIKYNKPYTVNINVISDTYINLTVNDDIDEDLRALHIDPKQISSKIIGYIFDNQ
jgi:hypothetical protein